MDHRQEAFVARLLREGIVSPDLLQGAEEMAGRQRRPLADCLIELGAREFAVTQTLAEVYGLPFIDLTSKRIPEAVIQLMPEQVAREACTLPLYEDEDTLNIVISDPTDIDLLEKLRFILNRRIHPYLAPRMRIEEAIDRYYGTEPE